MNKQRVALLTLGIGIGLIIGFTGGYVIGHSANKAATPEVQPQTVTLEGKMICLTHKDNGQSDGPHTLECAVGFQSGDNKTYGISTNSSDTTLSSAAGSDKKVRITGTIKAATNSMYEDNGTLQVKSYEFIK